ncbi:MAG: pyridoxal phosphate-dependent aminotransferase, partial [Microcystaceae cyanobacterium]
ASPNAPIGSHLNREYLAETCAQATGIVLIDEAYIDFSDETHWDFLKQFENVIISRTLSKSYSLAGMRVGFGISSPAIIAEMDKVRDSYNLDRLAQCLGTAALQATDEFKPIWQKIRQTREFLMQSLTDLDFNVLPSDANFVLVSPQWIAADQLYEQLKARKVLVRYFNQPRITDYVRITIGTEEETQALLTAITEIKKSV